MVVNALAGCGPSSATCVGDHFEVDKDGHGADKLTKSPHMQGLFWHSKA